MSTFFKQTDEHRVLISRGEKRENDQDRKIKQLAQKWGTKTTKRTKLRAKQP